MYIIIKVIKDIRIILKLRLSLVVMLYHHFKISRDIQTTGDDGFLYASQHIFFSCS